MIRVLLADDDPIFLENTSTCIKIIAEDIGVNINLFCYSEPDIAASKLGSFDIAILDIDFHSTHGSGIDLAAKIRKQRSDTVIIFLTSFIEYAPIGYELHAFRYLLKTDIKKKLKLYFSQAVKHLTTKRKALSVQCQGEIVTLPIDDILYLESDRHTIYINMNADKRKRYSCYSSLLAFSEKLEKCGFLRTHKSYLVNMRHIRKINSTSILLSSGETLSISTKNYTEIKHTYLLWKGEQTWST